MSEAKAIIAIIRAEMSLNLRRVAPWLLFILFCGNAALWNSGVPVNTRGWATNSDFNIARLMAGFSFLTLPLFTAMMMGDVVIRDIRLGVDAILLSKPISRIGYLTGKFFGNFLTLVACAFGYALTLFLVQSVATEGRISLAWRTTPYIKHFVLLIVISQLAMAAFCFAVGAITRSAKLVYGLVIISYVLYIALASLVGNRLPGLESLFDLLLLEWVNRASRGQSAAAINNSMIVYDGIVIANRLMLIFLAAACLFIAWLRFGKTEKRSSGVSHGTLGLASPVERLYDETGAMDFASEKEVITERRLVALTRPTISTEGLPARWSQFIAATVVEFRLLIAERSLIVLAPLVMISGGLFLGSFSGPFDAPLAPLSSIYAANSATALLITLFGVMIFYTGEAIDRDRELKVEDALWSSPAPDQVFLLSKFAALFALASLLVFLSFLTAVTGQIIKRAAPVDIAPYLIIYSAILLPSVALMIAGATVLNVLLRDKYLAHAAGLALAGGFFYLLQQGRAGWLLNPVLYNLWTYSDMTGLEPYRKGVFLHRAFWLAITLASLALAHTFFRRGATRERRRATVIAIASLIIAVGAGILINNEINRGPDSKWLEAARIRYEEKFASSYRDAPQPQWSRVDLTVELFPSEHRLHARGIFKLENRTKQQIETAFVSLDPTFDWRELSIDGVSRPPRIDELGRVFTFDVPLQPNETTTLRAKWDATIPQGLRRASSVWTNFILEGGTLLGGPDFLEWLPMMGYLSKWEISDETVRQSYGKAKQTKLAETRNSEPLPASDGGFPVAPFDLRVEIIAPRDQTALSSGRLVETRDEGERRAFVYETEQRVSGLVIVCAPYAEKWRGDLAVYYHPCHSFNVDSLLDAMEAARRKYERDYGPLPYRDLRMAEFPGLARFAISYATTIPCSENLVFISREDAEHVNANYFAAAHEIAHQWFGHRVVAARAAGRGVLLEGLAEYAAGALMDETLGKQATMIFRRFEERTYLDNRAIDGEPSLIDVDGLSPSDSAIIYQKAGLVFHMMENLIGRERMNAALREYVARFAESAHPRIADLIAILKKQTPDGSMDWFYDEWFYRVTLPDFRITAATMKKEGNDYIIEFSIENIGDGSMPVLVEAVAGDERSASSAQVLASQGATARGSIRCAFKPEQLVIDRLHDVIDKDRSNNTHIF